MGRSAADASPSRRSANSPATGTGSGRSSSLFGLSFWLTWWPALAVLFLSIQIARSLITHEAIKPSHSDDVIYSLVLLLGSGLAAWNALQSDQSIRLFWSFLAAGFGLWAMNPLSWMYYNLVLGQRLPGSISGGLPLFLHIVVFIAAVAARPHLRTASQRPYRTTLNFLLLLFFWVFLYAYLIVPLLGAPLLVRGLRFETLYFAENLFLIVALAILAIRTHGPWQLMYRHLFGASVLYALGSLAANLALYQRGYSSRILAVPYTAAGAWFVWLTLKGRALAPELAQVVRLEILDDRYVSIPANLAVVCIPLIGIWELSRAEEPYEARTARLLIVLISLVLLAAAAFLQHYLANRGLASEVGLAQYLLRESQARLEGIVSSAMDAIIAIDDRQRIMVFNAAAEKMFACTAQQAIGTAIERFIPQRFRVAHASHIRHFGESGVTSRAVGTLGTLWALRATGEEFPIEASISQVRTGEKKLFIVIVRDVTECRQTENALRESEERFRLVANAAPVMIWMSGTDKLCTYFNQPWLEFTGRALDEEMGNGWAEGVHPEDLQPCLTTYSAAFDQHEAFEMEYRLRRRDGEYRWIRDFGVPRFNADGSFAGYIGSCYDITERRRAHEALSSVSRRLIEAHEEERTWIARELHDDINQRVALLAVSLERLEQNLPASPAETRPRLEEAHEQVTQLGSEIQALSHRLHSSKLEYLGLAAAAASFCKEFCERHKVEIDFQSTGMPKEMPEEVSLCLFRILQEAVQNAARHSRSNQIQVSLGVSPGEIQLTVRDSGIGFDPGEAVNGRGLGLISMKERLKLVNGELSIDSQLRRGTVVQATVPFPVSAKANRAAG